MARRCATSWSAASIVLRDGVLAGPRLAAHRDARPGRGGATEGGERRGPRGGGAAGAGGQSVLRRTGSLRARSESQTGPGPRRTRGLALPARAPAYRRWYIFGARPAEWHLAGEKPSRRHASKCRHHRRRLLAARDPRHVVERAFVSGASPGWIPRGADPERHCPATAPARARWRPGWSTSATDWSRRRFQDFPAR